MYTELLKDKHILVTGASRGLGRAMAEYFAFQGARIAFNFSSDEEGAIETEKLVQEKGGECHKYRVSVLDGEGLQEMILDLEERWGGLDILVNNAGISQPFPLALLEEEDWDQVLDINLKGYYMLSRAVMPGFMRRKQGVILNIGSLAGMRLIASPVHYSASKAGIKGFTEALCKEGEKYNIRVNCLAPGLLEEGVGRNLSEHRLADYLEYVSLGRLGGLDEVSRFAGFLISERNSYMNGTTILMDGGL